MGRLTTHVLDTARGAPAAGLSLTLYRLPARTEVARAVTNDDGRCDAPLLEGAAFETGEYEIVFDAGAYLRASGAELPNPPFLDTVPIRFG
ncbi:MAG: hydroxyisourate hydrolase, partial [Pseudomonadota bacterium]